MQKTKLTENSSKSKSGYAVLPCSKIGDVTYNKLELVKDI